MVLVEFNVHLKRITITGFKSFAARTVLELSPGLTAVVGPNGSGKSNIADAVRWVLGEQSNKNLRAKKGEDVIFAGTDKKAKGSLAEVSLLLDNSDGHAKIDLSEIQITRKLYRSGESEYRLNDRKVRLFDIEQLLAQLGFGTETYTVIGQGMVDNLILASPAERKALFDEASGIKEFELGREQALRKLNQTETNIARATDVLAELSPRLASLERSATSARQRQHLSTDLEVARARYVTRSTEHYEAARAAAKQLIDRQKATASELRHQLAELEKRQSDMEQRQRDQANRSAAGAKVIRKLESDRDQLSNDLSVKRAELQFAEERQQQKQALEVRLAELEQERSQQQRRRKQLTKHLAEAQVGEQEHAERLAAIGKKIDAAQRSLGGLRRNADATSGQEYVTHALSILKQVSYGLSAESMASEELRLLVYKAGRLLGLASQGGSGADKIKTAQHLLTSAMKEREQAHGPYTQAVINVRSVELDLTRGEEELARLDEQIAEVRTSLRSHSGAASDRQRAITALERKLSETDSELQALRAEATTSDDPAEIFALATELEQARTTAAAAEAGIVAKQQELSEAEEQLKQISDQRKLWFGSVLPKADAGNQSVDDLRREVYVLEAKLEETASGDVAVLEEFEDAQKRHGFMNEQLSDLQSAATDVRQIVARLEAQAKTTFETNFAAIAKAFEQYFVSLFEGGAASLRLDTTDDGYGIEITAQPPGKRLQPLATLSGGERALAGTALLAAILSVNPSPFVILDEVDAALDEANSGRLAAILEKLTKHSQLIVITHNRQIMAAAQTLYGVTSDAHQASKLLSVRFDKAAELAARQ